MAISVGIRPTGQITIEQGGKARTFSNLVLEKGWRSLVSRGSSGSGEMVPKWLYFGTGETEPSHDDEALEQVAQHTGKEAASIEYGGFVNASDRTAYSEAIARFDYGPGEITGEWTELGLFYDSDRQEPYNRALVRDENGVPVPLLVLSDQPVTVYVRLRIHLDTEWGREIELGEGMPGVIGTISVDNNIAVDGKGVWQTGLPLITSRAGGRLMTRESLVAEEATSTFSLLVPPFTEWSASRLTLNSGSSTALLHVDFSPVIQKPFTQYVFIRVKVSLFRSGL